MYIKKNIPYSCLLRRLTVLKQEAEKSQEKLDHEQSQGNAFGITEYS